VIASPPSDDGADHDRLTLEDVTFVAARFVGASGATAKVATPVDADE
jgi:hypothetical protein